LILFVLFLAYFGIGVLFYWHEEKWSVPDTIYFATVVLSTVGYGDFLPSTDTSKLFTCFYIFYALIIGVSCLSHFFDLAYEHARVTMQKDEDEELFNSDPKSKRRRNRNRLLASLGFLVVILASCSILFGEQMDWTGYAGHKYVNGLYFSVVTLTTVGFGDITPERGAPMVICVVLIVLGIPAFGSSLQCMTEFILGSSDFRAKVIKNGLSNTKFHKLEQFTMAFEGTGGLNDARDAKISRFEFLAYMLVENDLLDMEGVAAIMQNFKELDADGSGFIEVSDLQYGRNNSQRQKTLRQSMRGGWDVDDSPEPVLERKASAKEAALEVQEVSLQVIPKEASLQASAKVAGLPGTKEVRFADSAEAGLQGSTKGKKKKKKAPSKKMQANSLLE